MSLSCFKAPVDETQVSGLLRIVHVATFLCSLLFFESQLHASNQQDLTIVLKEMRLLLSKW